MNTLSWVENSVAETSPLDDSIIAITTTDSVCQQLAAQGVMVEDIEGEWQSLKKVVSRWVDRASRKFPPESWEQIGSWVNKLNYSNLFALIDYILCHGVSSADVERGFSSLKNLKTFKRVNIGNQLLTVQLRAKIDGLPICECSTLVNKSIDSWLLTPGKNSRNGKVGTKRPTFMENNSGQFGPKPKKQCIILE